MNFFFKLWADIGVENIWMLAFAAFLIGLVTFIATVNIFKNKKEKFTRTWWFLIVFSFFCMYQMVPVWIYGESFMLSIKGNYKAAAEKVQKAINLSIFPWQKGAYYCNLGSIYLAAGDYKNEMLAYKNAYKYLKSYKAPCWETRYVRFYHLKEYDIAIELSQNYYATKYSSNGSFTAFLYCLKGDYKTAKKYIDKSLREDRKTSLDLATKAYIEKQLGNKELAEACFNLALELARNEQDRERAIAIYKDVRENERVCEACKVRKGGAN